MASYNDFYNTHLGRAYDVDGYYGAQCWDGYAEYCRYLGVPWSNCTATGYVRDLWEQRHANGILNYFTEVSLMKPGDVAIFKVCGVTPSSHVAIFHSDAGGGYGWFFGQNQGGVGGAFNLCKLPYSATYDTAFRPKAWSESITTTSSGYSEKQLINEAGVATLTKAVNKRRDTPTGIIAETLPVGKKLEYTQKWIGNGHRYISWVETEPNGNKYRYFVAVSAGEDYNSERWATISAKETSAPKPKPQPPKAEPTNKIDTSNVKHWGVDISELNGTVDLSKYDFAIIRACYGEYTDKKLGQWVSECNRLGIPFGLYCYDYALNDDEALAEARYILKLADKYQPKLGVWFDMEDADNYKKKRGALTKERCLKSCQIFCKAVKDAGWYTGVYSSTWWFNNWLTSGLDDYDKWVAQWDSNDGDYHSDTSKRGTIHQYTSIDKATGIGLDKNAMYVDFDHYKVKADKPSEEKPSEPQKEPTDDKKENDEQSNVESKKTLLDVLYELLKWILSLFVKKQGDK